MHAEHLFCAEAHLGLTFPFSIPSTVVQGSGHSRALQICIFNPGTSVLKGLTEMVLFCGSQFCRVPGFGKGDFR